MKYEQQIDSEQVQKKRFIDKLLFDYDLVDTNEDNNGRIESAIIDAMQFKNKEDAFILPSILALVEYLYEDEEANWIESDKVHAHIFHDVRAVSKWLNTKKITGDSLSK